jgi:hypothetical protein
MSAPKPGFAGDLSPSEHRFLAAMRDMAFGRFEFLQIQDGQLVLDPWPVAVRDVKFSVEGSRGRPFRPAEYELKSQVAEFFEYTRSVDVGEIRILEVRHGLPLSMEVELGAPKRGGRS